MSKRWGRKNPDEEDVESRADLSPEERRKLRKRERAAREAGNRKPGRAWKPLGTGIVVGIAGAVLVIIVVLLLFNPFKPPCLQLQGIPVATSGEFPGFPAHNATDLSTSWCPPGASPVFESFPALTIQIGHNPSLSLPTSIGRNSSYTQNGRPYSCNLPVFTDSVAQGGLPLGTIYVISPWNYIYNLSSFFHIWAESYPTVDVNSSFANQPIVYSTTDLLGFTTDATHAITLWVDNQPSNQGPNLNLDTTSNAANVYPSCLGTLYGTGHTILLSYTSTTAGAARVGLQSPVLGTGGGVPDLALELYSSPVPHLSLSLTTWATLHDLEVKGLFWLSLRPA